MERCRNELAAAREDILMREADLDAARQDLQSLRHELARRQAAQQAALGRTDEGVRNWLAEQGLDEVPRVGETLGVVPGWERAVEMVLGEFLQGLRVADAAGYADALATLSGGQVALVEARVDAVAAGRTAEPELPDPQFGHEARLPAARCFCCGNRCDCAGGPGESQRGREHRDPVGPLGRAGLAAQGYPRPKPTPASFNAPRNWKLSR